MKRGGRVIYAGELGHYSHKIVEYFEVSFLSLHVDVWQQDFTGLEEVIEDLTWKSEKPN